MMNWAIRICQSLVLINLIYGIVSLISNGMFLPIIPMEEFFASMMFLITGISVFYFSKLLFIFYGLLGVVFFLGAEDFLVFFLSNQLIDQMFNTIGNELGYAEILCLLALVFYLLLDVFKNRNKCFNSIIIPLGLLMVIVLALFFIAKYDFLLYFIYLALGLSSLLIGQFFVKEEYSITWYRKYSVFGYHALLILTNFLAFL